MLYENLNYEEKIAKDGTPTLSINNIFLHSSYNPGKEAEKFVTSIVTNFIPEIIFVTEPGLSYILPFLRTKFPDTKFCAIHYSNYFKKIQSDWDYTVYISDISTSLSNFLLNKFNEEQLSLSIFLSWNSSSKIFLETDKNVWNEIKKSVSQANTLLITREHFEKKWFLNSLIFFKYAKSLYTIRRKINIPVVIIASGPSLIDFIPVLKKIQNKVFIMCLSSALSVMNHYGINPDLVLSTDGGYWAGEHLKPLLLSSISSVLGITPESFVSKSLLKNNKILFLSYPDGISSSLLKENNLKSIPAVRNGTVSGTALYIASLITTNKIYFAGLDLSCQKGLQHSKPNMIETKKYSTTSKINTLDTSSFKSEINDYSLNIYLNWFQNQNFEKNRYKRIINEKFKHNSLGKIQDINIIDFPEYSAIESKDIFEEIDFSIDMKKINDFISLESKKDEWLRYFFPLTYISHLRNPENKELENKLYEKNYRLLKKAGNIINE